MTPVPNTQSPVARWRKELQLIDVHLPSWARRSHPIIRRHLGIRWKMLPLDIDVLQRVFVVQAVVVAFIMLVVPAAVPLIFAMLPISAMVALPLIYSYGRILLRVATFSTQTMTDEQENETLELLRTTPISLRDILRSKASAGVWIEFEDLSLVILAVAVVSLPIIGILHGRHLDMETPSLLNFLILMGGVLVSTLRLFLEPLMIASLAMAIGAGVKVRAATLTGVFITSFFYFLCLNMLRFIDLSLAGRVMVEFILPLVLPLAVTWGAFMVAERIIKAN